MDVHPATAYTPPPPGWARIELEPVDVPLEQDDSVLLSAIQSVIPGAHGLYYKDGDRKVALRYDGSTGRISKGPPGWDTKPIYVVLAHGCHHYTGDGTGQYNIATERFERTVNLVQRMLAGFDRFGSRYPYGQGVLSRTADRKRGGGRTAHDDHHAREEGHEARVDEEEHSDGSIDSGKCSKTSFDVQKLQDENDGLKQRIEELLVEIGYQRGQQIAALPSEIPIYTTVLDTAQDKGPISEDGFEKLKQEKEEVERQLAEERRHFADLEKARNDLEWSLGEHKQWLSNEQTKVNDLERMLDEEKNKAQSLANLNVELTKKLEQLPLGQQHHNDIHQLREALYEKELQIQDLKQKSNDAEWSLGENKQWLEDANNKVNHMDGLCQEKDRVIEDLTNKLREAERRLFEIQLPENIDNLSSTIENLRKEIDGKNDYIGQLEKTKNDAEWSLGEHRQWLEDAKNRIEILENEKDNERKRVAELEEKLRQVEGAPTAHEYSQMKTTIEELWQKMNDKNRECEKLNKQKDDAEWSLGEHKFWLENANKRIQYLEDEENEKDSLIKIINNELAELKEIRMDTFQQLHNKIGSLDTYLNEKERLVETKGKDINVEYTMLLAEVKGLQKEINDKDGQLKDANKLREGVEWNLDEHKRLLEDANNRIKELEEACAKNDVEHDDALRRLNDQIEKLQRRNDELQQEVQERQQAYEMLRSERDERRSLSALPEDDQMMKETHRLQVRMDELVEQLSQANAEREAAQRKNEEVRRAMEDLHRNLDDKEAQLENVIKSKNDAEWSLGEHRQWLEDSKNRINELEGIAQRLGEEKDAATTKLSEILAQQPEFNKKELDEQLHEKNDRINQLEKDCSDKHNEINSLKLKMEELLLELNDARQNAADIEQKKNDAEWSLSEHRQWLQDAKNKIDELENRLQQTGGDSDDQQKENEKLNADIRALLVTIESLQKQLSDRNEQVCGIEKQKTDAEWSLGEHRQWLQDARNRISDLEAALHDKDRCIDELKKHTEDQLREIEDRKSRAVPEEGKVTIDKEELATLYVKLQDAEKALFEAPNQDKLNELHSIIDGLRNELNKKNEYIGNLEKQRNDAEWKLGEHRQWLEDSKNRADWLDGVCQEKDRIIGDLERQLHDAATPETLSGLCAEIDGLKNELDRKNEQLADVDKTKNDAEWCLGEHRQWLADATNRIRELEAIVVEKEKDINKLRHELEDYITKTSVESDNRQNLVEQVKILEKKLEEASHNLDEAPKSAELADLRDTIDKLQKEISLKNDYIGKLEKGKNDAEWNLGEHRQWLFDAKNRVNALDSAVKEKDKAIDDLRLENEALRRAQDELKEVTTREIARLTESLEKVEGHPAGQENINSLNAVVNELRKELEQKSNEICDLIKQKDDAEWQLGEQKQWLTDAHIKTDGLEHLVREKDDAISQMHSEIHYLKDELEAEKRKDGERNNLVDKIKDLEKQLEERDQPLQQSPHPDDMKNLNATLEELRHDLTNKCEYIADLEKQRNDAQWNLGEHKEWLQDANNRAQDLENALHGRDGEVDELRKETERLLADIRVLHETIESLQNKLNANSNQIDAAEKAKNDAEWSLGEQKQWLEDANNKINGLENDVREKDRVIDELHCNLEKVFKDLEEAQAKVSVVEETDRIEREVPLQAEPRPEEVQKTSEEVPAEKTPNELKTKIEELEEQLNNKDECICDLEQQRNDAEWKLGEHKAWLEGANNRANYLDNVCLEKDCAYMKLLAKCEDLDKKFNAMRLKYNELLVAEPAGELTSADERLRDELSKKKDEIRKLTREKSETERSAVEQQQLLDDAHRKIGELKNILGNKGREIDDLHERIDDLSKNVVLDLKSALEAVQGKERPEEGTEEQLQYLNVKLAEAEQALAKAPKEDEIGAVRSTIDNLRNELNDKNNYICDLEKRKNDAEWSLGEHKQWLQDARNRIQDLENRLPGTGQDTEDLEKEIEKLNADIKALPVTIENLQNQLNDKNNHIGDVERARSDAEWSLGEHKQWLQDANNRIGELNNALGDKDREIADLRRNIENLSAKAVLDLKAAMKAVQEKNEPTPVETLEYLKVRLCETEEALANAPKPDEVNALKSANEGLLKEIEGKNCYIEDLEKAKNNAEWSLGEHRQWLQDANNRAAELDNCIQEKNNVIDNLQKQIEALRDVPREVPNLETWVNVESTPHKEVSPVSCDESTDVHATLDGLRKELNNKDDYIQQLIKQRNDAEWSLGEHKQWLNDTRNWAQSLANDLGVKDKAVEDLRVALENAGRVAEEARNANKEKIENLSKKLAALGHFAAEADQPQDTSCLDSTVANLRQQLENKENELRNLQKEKNDTEWSLGEHRQWLQDANYRAAGLENDLKDKRQYVDELQREIENLKHTLKDAQHAHEEAIRDLEAKLCDLGQVLVEAPKQSDVNGLNEAIENLHRELDSKNGIISNLEKARNDAEWSLGEHRQWLQDANNRVQELEDKMKGSPSDVEDLRKEVEKLNADIRALVETIESLQNHVDSVEKARDDAEWGLGEHKHWLQDAKNRIADLENVMNDKNRIIDELNERTGKLQDELDDARSRLLPQEADITDKDRKIDELRQNIEDLIKEIEVLKEHTVPKDVHDDLQRKLQDFEQATAETPISEQLANLHLEIETLRRDLDTKNEHIGNLEQLKNNAEWSLGEHKQWLEDIKTWANSLEDELKNKNNAIGSLEQQLRNRDEAMDNLKTENDDLKEKLQQMERERDAGVKLADFEALKNENENLHKDLEDKNCQLLDLERRLGEVERNLGENRQKLCDASNRANSFESLVNEKNDVIDDLSKQIWEKDGQIDKLQKEVEGLHADLEQGEPHLVLEQFQTASAPSQQEKIEEMKEKLNQYEQLLAEAVDADKLKSELENLRQEIAARDHHIRGVEKERNDKEWSLGEHRQWLQDSRSRTQDLENKLKEDEEEIEALRKEVNRLVADINSLCETISSLQKQLAQKDAQLGDLEKQKNEAEWSLGEHREWLQDARNRADVLENTLKEKDQLLDNLRRDNDEIKRAEDDAKAAYKDVIDKLQSRVEELEQMQREGPKGDDISELNKIIGNLRNDLEDKNCWIGNLEQERQNAGNRIAELENSDKTKGNAIKDLHVEIEELSKNVVLDLKAALEAVQEEAMSQLAEVPVEQLTAKLQSAEQGFAELPESADLICLRAENEDLKKQLDDKNACINDLAKQRDDKEWNLGEHQQWLRDATDRANWLDRVVLDKNREIDGLRCEIDQLRSDLVNTTKPCDINDLNATIANLQKDIDGKNNYIGEIEKQRNDTEWKLGEHRQWLQDANNRANELQDAVREKDQIIGKLNQENEQLKSELTTASRSANVGVQDLENAQKVRDDELDALKKEIERLLADIRALCETIESLQKQLNDKDDHIGNVEKQRNEAEWSLGEHRQWLQDAINRANALEDAVKHRNEEVNGLRQENDRLREALAAVPASDNLESLEKLIDELNKTIEEKNADIENLEKVKNDTEWSLGEHRQWLVDANNRVIGLETSNYEKDNVIDRLRRELDALRSEQPEVRQAQPVENASQLREKVQELEKKLEDAELFAGMPKDDRIRSLESHLDDLNNDLREKDDYIGRLEKERNDKEWSLGEHRQWLNDANSRIAALENEIQRRIEEIDAVRDGFDDERHNLQEKADELAEKLNEKENVLNLLRQQHPEIGEEAYVKTEVPLVRSVPEEVEKSKLFEKIFELEEKLHEAEKAVTDARADSPLKTEYEAVIAQLRKDLDQKNADLEYACKERCDAEWFLGEERQRVADADKRIEDLVNCLSAKEEALNALTQQNDELRNKLEDVERKLMDAAAQSSVGPPSISDEASEQRLHALICELNDLKADYECVQRARDEVEWYLGEHRQQLTEERARIAQLEDELTRTKKEYDDTIQNLRDEAFELREKNTKLEETLRKTEVVVKSLKKEAKTSMLILEQTIGPENLEEEFRKLREKYVQVSDLLVTTEERLARLQTEAAEFGDSSTLRKVIENLNEELRQRNVENEGLNKQKNDAEWHLGEHREWLRNANNRISILEDELERVKETDERTIMGLRAENEALNKKNTQIKEEVKHLEEEIQAIRSSMDGKEERDFCARCREGSEFSYAGSVGDDLSAVSRSLQDLRKELNYQKIIDTLMEQRSSAERAMDDQKQSLTDAYNRIADLERRISESVPEEQPEIIETRTDVTKTMEEAEKLSRLEYNRSQEISDLQNHVDALRQQLNDKCAQVENLEKLKVELERSLEEARNRSEVMSASLDEKQRAFNAISDEKNAIAAERDALKQQVDDLEKRFKGLQAYGTGREGASDEEGSAREMEVKLHEKEDQLQQITSEITEKEEEITNLHAVIQELRDEINEKNRIIDDLNRITSEKEWNLGEHRQWLADANNKASYLETELNNIREGSMSNQEELDLLRSEMDEKNAKISELHKKVAELESEAIDVQYQKEMTPSELELKALQEKLSSMEEYVQFQNEELDRLKQEHAQTLTEQQSNPSPTSPSARSAGFDTSVMSEDYNDLSSELITLNRRKYKLEEKVKQLETELQAAHDRITWLEGEQRKNGEEIWLAKERVANQDRELGDLHGQCSWLRDENARLESQIEEDRKRYAETGGVDWSKFDELKDEMKQKEDTLKDEKSKIEWRLGEVTQFWNDAKWKIGELEAGMAHKQWLLDQANQKICENENSPDDLRDYRRVWFEITASTANIVLLCASFVNWECFLQCQKFDNEAGKFGVWVDIPPGRYEFVFVVDGIWTTSSNYPTCYNEHGTQNNCIHVD